MSTDTGSAPDACVRIGVPRAHVAVVTIDRPEARNAVNNAVAVALGAAVQRLEADPEIWCVVLTGAGDKVFSAGADLKEISAGRLHSLFTPEGGFAGFVQAPRRKPWIAAVNGFALAGGCELALACDMIVASDDATFGLPEVTRGLVASAGGVYRLPRALPRALAMELIATGNRFEAARALQFGMINHVVPKARTLEFAVELAASIAANAPVAVRESLAIARLAYDTNDASLARLSSEAQIRVMLTDDFKEGPLAFVEKRAPRWVGH